MNQAPASPRTGAFTLLDDGHASQVSASPDGSALWLPADDLRSATGWELKPQGLCRDEVCIPVRGGMVDTGGSKRVNLGALAEALGRPLAVDPGERVAYLGASSQERADALRSLEAPDFELPDLNGKLHRLIDQRGKKVLLVAYASW